MFFPLLILARESSSIRKIFMSSNKINFERENCCNLFTILCSTIFHPKFFSHLLMALWFRFFFMRKRNATWKWEIFSFISLLNFPWDEKLRNPCFAVCYKRTHSTFREQTMKRILFFGEQCKDLAAFVNIFTVTIFCKTPRKCFISCWANFTTTQQWNFNKFFNEMKIKEENFVFPFPPHSVVQITQESCEFIKNSHHQDIKTSFQKSYARSATEIFPFSPFHQKPLIPIVIRYTNVSFSDFM